MASNIVEQSMGRFAKRFNFSVEPIGTPNIDEIQPAKYILQHFMDM